MVFEAEISQIKSYKKESKKIYVYIVQYLKNTTNACTITIHLYIIYDFDKIETCLITGIIFKEFVEKLEIIWQEMDCKINII